MLPSPRQGGNEGAAWVIDGILFEIWQSHGRRFNAGIQFCREVRISATDCNALERLTDYKGLKMQLAKQQARRYPQLVQ